MTSFSRRKKEIIPPSTVSKMDDAGANIKAFGIIPKKADASKVPVA